MKFNSQICTTKEQSERLLALGLKKETADMTLQTALDVCYTMPFQEAIEYFENRHLPPHPTILPAWSLHRLIEMIPDKISYPTKYDSAPLRINKDSMYYLCRFFDRYGDEDFNSVGDNEAIGSHNIYDYAVSVIAFLIKEGHFNKEYLEE